MCGLTGFIQVNNKYDRETLQRVVGSMTQRLFHRGPDDGGTWVDVDSGIAFGHRRLSIIDLSPEGHQPMFSDSGRYVIVFNGEIYNYKAIRKELETIHNGIRWRGHSDTEVMLSAISEWGVDKVLRKINGMFAFALWDKKERVLYLSRDRTGEKPLYYGWSGDVFLFGSELKSFCKHPSWTGEIDRNAISLFLRYNCVPGPHSIYKGIYKLQPGNILKFNLGDSDSKCSYSVANYWSVQDVISKRETEQYNLPDQDAVGYLDNLLRDAVKIRMESDVPIGAFLSGGVDSSTIVALMQAQSSRAVKTFTIGFSESAYNEADNAKAVALHLGTDHTELYITPEDAMAVIPRLPTLYDEPFADSSQIPTFLVSQLTKRYVTVALSGDGGDELFGGYNRHFWAPNVWEKIKWMPTPLKRAISSILLAPCPETWDRLFQKCNFLLPRNLKQRTPGYKIQKLAELLNCDAPWAMYKLLASHWHKPDDVVIGASEPSMDIKSHFNSLDFAEGMMYMDLVGYLPDDILVKVDRASMGVSLEARVPLIDHRVIEFAWRLPISMKIRDRQGKWLLKQVLYKYVPKELIERPKAGFGVPIDQWLRGPLRDWAEDLLDENKMKDEGFFNPEVVKQKWKEHLLKKRNWQYHLWDVLMFQSWLRCN